jgi:hypothetical protein
VLGFYLPLYQMKTPDAVVRAVKPTKRAAEREFPLAHANQAQTAILIVLTAMHESVRPLYLDRGHSMRCLQFSQLSSEASSFVGCVERRHA